MTKWGKVCPRTTVKLGAPLTTSELLPDILKVHALIRVFFALMTEPVIHLEPM